MAPPQRPLHPSIKASEATSHQRPSLPNHQQRNYHHNSNHHPSSRPHPVPPPAPVLTPTSSPHAHFTRPRAHTSPHASNQTPRPHQALTPTSSTQSPRPNPAPAPTPTLRLAIPPTRHHITLGTITLVYVREQGHKTSPEAISSYP